MDDFGTLNLSDDNNVVGQNPASNMGDDSGLTGFPNDNSQSDSSLTTTPDPVSDDSVNVDLTNQNGVTDSVDMNNTGSMNATQVPDVPSEMVDAVSDQLNEIGDENNSSPNLDSNNDFNSQFSDQSQQIPTDVSMQSDNMQTQEVAQNDTSSVDDSFSVDNSMQGAIPTDQTQPMSQPAGSMQQSPVVDPNLGQQPVGPVQQATPTMDSNQNMMNPGMQQPQPAMQQTNQTAQPTAPMPPINVPPDKDPNVYRFLVDAIYAKHGTGVDVSFVTQEADRLYVQLGDTLVNTFEGDLNDQQREEFNSLVAQGYKNEDLQGYLLQNITNLEQRIQEILIQFRDNYMSN